MFVFKFVKKNGREAVDANILNRNLLQDKRQFSSGKSQSLSDFLQTVGYAKKNTYPKQRFGIFVTVSRLVRERVYLRTCDLNFLCKNGCFFLF